MTSGYCHCRQPMRSGHIRDACGAYDVTFSGAELGRLAHGDLLLLRYADHSVWLVVHWEDKHTRNRLYTKEVLDEFATLTLVHSRRHRPHAHARAGWLRRPIRYIDDADCGARRRRDGEGAEGQV